jgi:hypothetical protein
MPFTQFKDKAAQRLALVNQVSEYTKFLKSRYFIDEKELRMVTNGRLPVGCLKDGSVVVVNGEYRKKLHLALDDEKLFEGVTYPLAISKIMTGPKTNHSKVKRFCDAFFSMANCRPPELEVSKIPFV